MSFDPEIDGDDRDDETPLTRAELVRLREERDRERRDRERAEARLDEWLRTPRQQEARQEEPPLGPMPDPVEDREAFQRWELERDARRQREIERRLEAQEQRILTQTETRSRQSVLWQMFQAKYPEHAKRQALAGTAFQRIVSRDGLEQDDATLVDAVAREMDSLVGHPIAKIGKEGDRTVGLSAGDRSVNKQRRPRDEGDDDDAPATLAESIFKRQVQLGLV